MMAGSTGYVSMLFYFLFDMLPEYQTPLVGGRGPRWGAQHFRRLTVGT